MTASTDTAPGIEVRDVRKRFGSITALDGVTLVVPRGRIHGLLGPNGAGKTTLIRAIVGLVRVDEGEVHVLSHRMPDRAVLGRVGYMTQAAALYEDLTAEENVRFFAAVSGAGDVNEALDFVDLLDRRRSVTATLSGGMHTRLSLACALVHKPELLLLDEPFSGLDVGSGLVLRSLMQELAGRGKVVLFSSHELETVERVCSRVVILHRGKVVADDSIAHLRTLMAAPTLEAIFSQLAVEQDTVALSREIADLVQARA
jgi:ABC-2 type transport system ATP-binding protein